MALSASSFLSVWPPETSKKKIFQIFVKDISFDSEFHADHKYRVESRKKSNSDRKKIEFMYKWPIVT